MNRTRHAVVVLILVALSCSTATSSSRTLPLAVQEFNEAVAWKHFQVTARYISPDAPEGMFKKFRTITRKIDIVEAEPIATTMSPDGESAVCLVRFSWYSSNDLTVHKGTELQEWKKRQGEWFLAGQKPPQDPDEPCSPFVSRTPQHKKHHPVNP